MMHQSIFSIKKITKLLFIDPTSFDCWPILPGKSVVLVVDSSLGKDQPRDLSAAASVEVGELIFGGHFALYASGVDGEMWEMHGMSHLLQLYLVTCFL